MLERYLGSDKKSSIDWESLEKGAPTIIGFARLCGEALSQPAMSGKELSAEAKLILFLARQRGVLELRGTNDAFDSCDRLLTVHIELDEDQVVALKAAGNVKQMARFLEGFRQVCQAGLLLHHLQREFSLSTAGFQQAELVSEAEVADLLAYSQPSV